MNSSFNCLLQGKHWGRNRKVDRHAIYARSVLLPVPGFPSLDLTSVCSHTLQSEYWIPPVVYGGSADHQWSQFLAHPEQLLLFHIERKSHQILSNWLSDFLADILKVPFLCLVPQLFLRRSQLLTCVISLCVTCYHFLAPFKIFSWSFTVKVWLWLTRVS